MKILLILSLLATVSVHARAGGDFVGKVVGIELGKKSLLYEKEKVCVTYVEQNGIVTGIVEDGYDCRLALYYKKNPLEDFRIPNFTLYDLSEMGEENLLENLINYRSEAKYLYFEIE